MNQKEGVFKAVRSVFPEGKVPATGEWTKEQSSLVTNTLAAMFRNNEVEYKGGCPDDARLLKYIPGLVNNWVRKDTRLNGGEKYQTKNPGSRTGSGDETLKNMRILLSATTDPTAKQLIQAEIDKRVEALKPKVEVNVEALPESLRHLVPQAA